jgi:hypothetical protein
MEREEDGLEGKKWLEGEEASEEGRRRQTRRKRSRRKTRQRKRKKWGRK